MLTQEQVEEIKKRLLKTYSPRSIYMLEQQPSDERDVAILVVVDQASLQARYELMAEGHKALIGMKIAKLVLVYTQEEFDTYAADISTLSYDIKNHGKCIYARA